MTTTSASVAILGRAAQQQKRRPICVYDDRQGLLTTPGDTTHRVTPHSPLSAILARLEGIFERGSTCTLYLCAGTHADTAPAYRWYQEPALRGWTVTLRRESNPARRSASYVRAESPTVELRHTSSWFGDMEPSPHETLEALLSLEKALEERWHSRKGKPVILSSAAQTGLDLLEKMLPFDIVFPVLDEDIRELIHRTTTQARIEFYPTQHERMLSEVYDYDQQFAYGSQLIRVPCPINAGLHFQAVTYTPVLDARALSLDELWRPARYRAVWKVPPQWTHVGILPELLQEWTWPAEPGTWHHGWIDHRELALARRHGWEIHLHEALLFAPAESKRRYDPLRDWRELLTNMWSNYHIWEQDGDTIAGLCKAAIRAMVLGSIGSWHRTSGRATVLVPDGQPLPPLDDMLEPPRMTGYGLEYVSRVPIHRSQQKWQRPEWSAAIWAAQRADLTETLLNQNPLHLIGCNTDGITTAAPRVAVLGPYEVLQASRPGFWREKGHAVFPEPVAWPSSRAELQELQWVARGFGPW